MEAVGSTAGGAPMQVEVNDRLLLVGTAHVSAKSVAEVEAAIASWRPDVVCVELDGVRLEALENRRQWEETPIQRLLKGDKLWLFLIQILLASYQRRLGNELGVDPGAEMLTAVRTAREHRMEVVLADRDIGATMGRAYRRMRWREKLRLSWEITKGMMPGESDDEELDVEELMEQDVLTQVMSELGEMAPSIKSVVIDERDEYLAAKIREPVERGRRTVAVVGAGHVAGIQRHLAQDRPHAGRLAELEAVPKKRFGFWKAFGYAFPALLVLLFAYFAWLGVQEGNWDKLLNSLTALVLWGGGLAALGALLARAHILSILTAFVMAPFTILHPGLAAGWFSGLVEAWRRTPVVKDFQNLSQLESTKGFFRNPVIHILIVAALTNIGAMIGGFIAAGRILTELDLPGL
jgi:pheromone shutdown-related protein TraB